MRNLSILKSLLRRGNAATRPAWSVRATTFFFQWPLVAVGMLVTYQVEESTRIIGGPGSGFVGAILFFAAFSLSSLIIAWFIIFGLDLVVPGFAGRVLGPTSPDIDSIREAKQFDEFLEKRNQLDAKSVPLLDRLIVIQGIDERVERLRNRSSVFLAAIAVALAAAAVVVLFAGRLTSLDAEAVSNVDRGKAEVTEAVRNLNRLLKYQSLFQQLDKATLETNNVPSTNTEKKIADLKKEIDNLGSGYSSGTAGAAAPIDVDTAVSMVSNQRKEVDTLEALVDDIRKKELLADRGYGDWRYIVATAITRVGVVLIIVFLVQILMGLYRYNTKLLAYYNSRRDLFTLWDGKPTALESLDKSLTLPPIDFGKEPKHPLEDIIRAIGNNKGEAATGKRSVKT